MAARGLDCERRTPGMSDFESQVKTEMYGEGKRGEEIKNSHWLSSLRGRLRHGPSSESQRRTPGEFGHSRCGARAFERQRDGRLHITGA